MDVFVDSVKKGVKKVVYVQMRQYLRDVKTGTLKPAKTKTKCITVHETTIAEVEAVIRKG